MVVCGHAWTFPGCQFCTVYNATVSRSLDTILQFRTGTIGFVDF